MPADRPRFTVGDMAEWMRQAPFPEPRTSRHPDEFEVALRQVRQRNLALFIQHPESPHEEN